MECFLHCCDNTHDPIPLPDGVDVVVGRLPQLKIKSVKCSRKQVQLTADYKENEVKVKQFGKHPSTIAGHKLTQGQTSTLGPGGQICLLDNDYAHFIYFKIPQTVKSPPKSMKVDEYFENKSKNPKGVSPVKNRLKRKIEETGDDLCFDSKKIKNDGVDGKRSKSTTSNRKRKLQENDDKDHADSKKMKTDFNDGTRPEPSSKDLLTEVEHKNNDSKNLSPSENKKQNIDGTDDDSCVKSKKSKTLSNDARPQSVCGDITTDECNEDDAVSVGIPCTSSTWDEIPGELMVYTRKGVEGRSKIAGFDMDGTLITTKSGKVFPRDTGDWKILLPHIPGKLKSLWSEGFKIVIFTNQNGIAKKKVTIPDFKKKIEHVVQALCVPIQVIISPGTGHYRKPSPGMWQYLCNNLNQGIKINKDKSYYIGDAAGRPVGWAPGKKKDFSCSDRAFASNVGMNFQTPEEFFLDRKPAPYEMPAFNPKKLDPNRLLLEPSTANLLSKEKEVIIMVGFPASGKSTFCEKYLVPEGYVRVNRDSLGTWQKCVSSSRSALSQGKSVVVDNTNGDKVSRQRYIDCAKEAKVPVRCFIMNVDKEHAEHNNKFREALNTDNNYKKVSTMVYNTYKKAFVEPSKEEGFSEIVRVQFKPFFKNEETRKIYNQYL